MDVNLDSSEHFFLKWDRATQDPELFAVEVVESRDYDNIKEGWIAFRYLQGLKAGCIEGAPKRNIITRDEAVEVYQKCVGAKKARADSKALATGVKNTRDSLFVKLSKEDREL